jgi:hypothetical protein
MKKYFREIFSSKFFITDVVVFTNFLYNYFQFSKILNLKTAPNGETGRFCRTSHPDPKLLARSLQILQNPWPHRKTHAAAAAAMNPVHAEKPQRKKDKKEKRKKVKDAVGDACAAATTEEETSPRNEKKKQRKEEDAGKDKAVPRRKPTVSIAVAGSIIDNAQSLELATLVRTPLFSVSISNPLSGPLSL